jgi:hypothetical protein
MRRTATLLAVSSTLLGTTSAAAEPQWHVGLQPALALDTELGELRPAFQPSAEFDVTWGRERSGDVGVGAGFEVGTWAFQDLRLAPMGHVLLPTGPLDLVVAAGPAWRVGPDSGPGVSGRLALGYRPFNYSGAYQTGFAVFAGIDEPLPADSPKWIVGAHLDGMWTALPFIILVSWLRGNPEH